jgi:ABC-type branched-subunit amino acid transport system ATPase component
VLQASDRVTVMVKGQVALDAPSATLAADPAQLHRFLGV